MKKILFSAILAALTFGTVACGDIEKTIDTATDIAANAANCKKTAICTQSENFANSIKGSATCEEKAVNGTKYITDHTDDMKSSVTEYSGVTNWKTVDSGTCSLITIKKIADCARDMKKTYDDIAACESIMTEDQKNAFNSLDNFNTELEKVANESSSAANDAESE